MNYIYKIRESRISDEAGREHEVFGIAVYHGERKACRVVADIFESRAEAEYFAELCNRLSLDPDQLDDVIADRLGV